MMPSRIGMLASVVIWLGREAVATSSGKIQDLEQIEMDPCGLWLVQALRHQPTSRSSMDTVLHQHKGASALCKIAATGLN